MRHVHKAALIAALALVCSCSASNEKFRSLLDQGILPLSVDNPYNGANLFIAHAAEESPVFLDFLVHRGAPNAIELREQDGSQELLLFYRTPDEYYIASPETNRKQTEWIVRGPFSPDRHIAKVVTALPTGREPILVVAGLERRMKPAGHVAPARQIIELKLPPIPTPRPAKRAVTLAQKEKIDAALLPADPTEGKFISTDLNAILISQGYAERSVDGDLIHQVRAGETLVDLVNWYTGSTNQLTNIAAINGVATDAVLVSGQQVRFPKNSLKQFKNFGK